MIDKILPADKGVSHDVFVDADDEEGEAEEVESTNDDQPAKPVDILTEFKHVFVPEVVREPRMHYQKVPRLGCFMTVPLVYQSCLS